VLGTLTSNFTAPPAGLQTRCGHTPKQFLTVQDATGRETTVGYDLQPGAPSPSLAALVGQTVSLRVRSSWQFQYDTDSVGFALQDGNGLAFAVYGGTVYTGTGAARPEPGELEGIVVTPSGALCSTSSFCGVSNFFTLAFQGSNTIVLDPGASGTILAGGVSYAAHHVATVELGSQMCTDGQDWQGWSLSRSDL
jgi:hypothetical protein